MAETKLISTLLAHSDMEVILSAIKAYVDKQVELANGDTTAVANLLNAVIGADDKAGAIENQKTIRAISAEEVAKIVANADTKYDTLKEIADWILSDTTGAAKMASDILQLQNYVGVPADGETAASGLFKAIADEAGRADTAEKANAKAISDEETRAKAAEKDLQDQFDEFEETTSESLTDLNGRLETVEGLFEGDNSVDAKIAAAQKAAEDHSDANLETAKEDATTKVNALKDTAVSSTSTNGPATVTLGGTVGAPTVTVAITMATAEEIKTLTDMFAISAE